MGRFWSVLVDVVLQQTKGVVSDKYANVVFTYVNFSKLKSFTNPAFTSGGRLSRYMVFFSTG